MTVKITDPDAFEKMVAIEGERYREHRTTQTPDRHSFDIFLVAFQSRDPKEETPWLSTSQGDEDIYGAGGWHRYMVRHVDGALFFHSAFSYPEKTQKAKDAGFDIF